MFDEELYDYDEEQSQPIARCCECQDLIYDNNEEVFIDNNGHYFCCRQCVDAFYGITQIEDYMG